MSFPDWVLKFKQKNTELRLIRGKYYLYKVSSIWDKEKKRARKISGEMIGRITEEEGLVPKGTKKTKSDIPPNPINICTKEYGASSFLQTSVPNLATKLQEHFPNEWQQIITLATQRLIYSAPLKSMAFLYEESYLSEIYQNLDISKNTLTSFMQSIGQNREKIADFMKNFVDGSTQLVFDVTNVSSKSKLVKASAVGYNSNKGFESQVNLFYVFSTDKQLPVYYRIFPGNITGVKALKNCMRETGAKDILAIGDKGFYSKDNAKELDENGINYIFPLKRDSALISYDRLSSRDYKHAFDGHFFFNDRVIFYNTQEVIEKDINYVSKKVTVFYDKSLALDEEKSYLRNIQNKVEGYNMDGYMAKQLRFGTMSMITNVITLSPQKIYENYKSRMEIETLFDSYKNLLGADKTYMQSDNAMEAWMFVNHISMIMYYDLYNRLKAKELLSHLSPADIITRLSRINKIKIAGTWYLSEINTKTLKLLKNLNIHIT